MFADRDTFARQLDGALDSRPTMVVDDGADLTATVHTRRRDLLDGIAGRGLALRARGMGARVVVCEAYLRDWRLGT